MSGLLAPAENSRTVPETALAPVSLMSALSDGDGECFESACPHEGVGAFGETVADRSRSPWHAWARQRDDHATLGSEEPGIP